jgi:hypothetical protein
VEEAPTVRTRYLAVPAVLLAIAALLGITAPARADEPDVRTGSFVFIGVAGLRWSDIDRERTPTLHAFASGAATAAMAVRTIEAGACPMDGWLTLNSGSRSGGPRGSGACAGISAPTRSDGGVRFDDWAFSIKPNEDYSYSPTWGTLSAAPDACAVGPGAALALAHADGTVTTPYAATLDELDSTSCRLLLIDGGALPEGPDRPLALRNLDNVIGNLDLTGIAGSTVLIAGIADSDPDHPHLTAVMLRSDVPGAARRLHSPSTRQTGLVQLTDLTPTLLRGAAPDDLPGAELEPRAGDSGFPDEFDVAAQTVKSGFVFFFIALIAGQVLAFAAIAFGHLRGGVGRAGAGLSAQLVGLWFGAAPLATYLVNLAPWPDWSAPAGWMWTSVGLGAVLIGSAAAALRVRFGAYGPPAAIAAATVLILAADVAATSELQLKSPLGLSPLVAGRFYGFGNIAFAVFAMSALLVATTAWVGLVDRGRRTAMLALVGIGAAAIVVDGAPGLGTDFGGVLALGPGLAVLALLLAGIRLSVPRLVAIGSGTVATVAALAIVDWTRPAADRTHLGEFVQDVIDGNALDVIGRKADANLGLFVSAPIIVVIALPLLVAAVLAVARPQTLRLGGLVRAQEADPAFRALLIAALTTALLGFAANDSGIIVPAVALFTGAPLFIAVWAHRWAETSPVTFVRQREGSAPP